MSAEEFVRLAYYPGCEAKTINKAADEATRKICKRFGVGLIELENAGCCGSVDLRIQDFEATLALNGRILALTEETGVYSFAGGRPYLFTICNTCAYNLQTAAFRYNPKYVEGSQEELDKLNKTLAKYGRIYRGTANVMTLPWVMIRTVGYPAFRDALVKPLNGLKIAPFYGCHMLRPDKYYGFENPMKPTSLDILIKEFMDGDTVEYKSKSLCCAFHKLMTEEKTSYLSIGHILKDAVDHDADMVVTPCTQCQVALDLYQREAVKEIGEEFEIPIVYLSQLIGIATGIPKEELGFKEHVVSPIKLLEKKRF
ncbi:MAG: hypothetical protein GTO54_12345 [Nitrososphaeria archaeon]|nr:hypothetical protein [Nitrososphaeria archaeon]